MAMKRSHIARGLLALPLVAVAAVAQPAVAAHQATHKTWTVKEQPGKAQAGFVFSPAKLTIHVGDTVKWVDKDSTPHNIVGQNSASKKLINRAAFNTKSYSVTFKKKGTYKYVCQIHPGMDGQITVK
jgi:plastocyanin